MSAMMTGWTYCGLSSAGFCFRVDCSCATSDLLSGLGVSKAARGRLISRGQLTVSRAGKVGPSASRPAAASTCVGSSGPLPGHPVVPTPLECLEPAAFTPVSNAGARLSPGDILAIRPLVTREPGFSSDMPVRVLYEDEFVLAVDKPQGILVHSDGSDADTLTACVQGYLRRSGSQAVPQALQRLDVDTSGVVLFSKTEEFQCLFDALVASGVDDADAPVGSNSNGDSRNGSPDGSRGNVRSAVLPIRPKAMRKTYLAIVHGAFVEKAFACDQPVGRDRHDARKMRVSPTGQPSLTHVERLAVAPDRRHSLLRVTLGTGRRHQIRVHLASLGHPVANDELYGTVENSAGRMLHAMEEEFVHPITGELVHAGAGWPGRFDTWFDERELDSAL